MAQHERYHIGDNPSLWALSGGIVVRVERSETRGNTKSPAFPQAPCRLLAKCRKLADIELNDGFLELGNLE